MDKVQLGGEFLMKYVKLNNLKELQIIPKKIFLSH
jgi:hypothetical protein